MNLPVLVTYATRSGSTAGVAERIAAELKARGVAAEVRPVKEAGDPAGYRAVVLGSPVRAGRLMPEALKFVQRHQAALAQRPFAAFAVCLAMSDPTEANCATALGYLEPVRSLVKPAAEAAFAGAYDPARASFLERQIMKMVKARPGDFRNWAEIDAWAAKLAELLGI